MAMGSTGVVIASVGVAMECAVGLWEVLEWV